MADELSIEETNALRASLGLPPLRARKAPSGDPSAAPAEPAQAPNEPEKDDKSEDAEDDEDAEPDLGGEAVAQDGSILVLEDTEILAGKRVAESRKRPKLVGTGAGTGTLDKSKSGLDKKNFIANIARSDALIRKEEEPTERPEIVGARLYQGDAQMDVEEEAEPTKKKKQKRTATVAQTRIIRRNVIRSAVALGGDDDERDDASTITNIAPKSFGNVATIEEDDDVKALEASLMRARKAASATSTISTQIKRPVGEPGEDDQYEVFVPSSAFAFVAPKAPEPDGVKVKQEQIEPDRSMLGIGSSPRITEQPPVTADVQEPISKPTDTKNSTVASAAPSQPHPVRRRALASTLMAIQAEGDGKRDEIIVGRANDPKPELDLNKPGDLAVLEYRDDHGHLLTKKEAYRQLMYQYRGEGPGAKKKKKRETQITRELAARSAGSSSGAGTSGVGELTKAIQKDHVVLWKH